MAGKNVLIRDARGGAGFAFRRDGRETVVRCDEDVRGGGHSEFGQRRLNLSKDVVRILNRCERCGAVDSRLELIQAVALVMLRAIRITGPENKKERFAAFLEHRQEYLCHQIGKITLLLDVRRFGSRYGKSTGLSIRAARRRNERQAGLLDRFDDIRRQWYSVRASR